MGLFKSQENHFGLDIGSTGVRVVQLKPANPNPVLLRYGYAPVESKITQSDAELDQKRLIEVIKKLLHDSKISAKSVVAGLPSAKVYASLVKMPKMTHQELAKSIKYQAEQYIPMPLDQVKLDWAIVSDTQPSPNGTQETQELAEIDVLLVATPISVAERYLNLLEAMDLDVLALEPDAAALGRSLVYSHEITAVVLDMGARSTDLVTIQNGVPKLLRSIPVGGDTLVKAAAQNLGLEEEQAMQFVYKFGLTQTKLEGQVKKSIKNSVDSLVAELDKSNKFFLSQAHNSRIEKVVINGKASLLPEFPTYLANAVGLPVEIGNPWSRIATPAEQQQELLELASQFGVAAGLAMRGMV